MLLLLLLLTEMLLEGLTLLLKSMSQHRALMLIKPQQNGVSIQTEYSLSNKIREIKNRSLMLLFLFVFRFPLQRLSSRDMLLLPYHTPQRHQA